MNTLTKRILTAALSASLLAPLATGAQAGGWGDRHGYDRGWGHGRGYDRGWEDRGRIERHRDRREERRRKRDNSDAALAAGVIGLAAGAILLGTMSGGASASTPPPAYYPPAPAPGPVYGTPQASPGYLPWSPAWYDYCSSRYRSFNPQTGTFTTYGGEQRFCQ